MIKKGHAVRQGVQGWYRAGTWTGDEDIHVKEVES